jgi:predicted ATPase
VIKELDRLKVQLESYTPSFNTQSSSFSLSNLWKSKGNDERFVTNAPSGVYIFGAVGKLIFGIIEFNNTFRWRQIDVDGYVF